jgi:hypothetical protein
MWLPRPQFTVRRIMVAVGAVALLLATFRLAVDYLPHIRRCWDLAANEELISRAYWRAASGYRNCIQTVPCAPSDYCFNACLKHASAHSAGQTSAFDGDRTPAANQHRLAAEDHEHAAELHAARARLYRRAAFRLSRPLPIWTAAEQAAADVFDRYRCDSL